MVKQFLWSAVFLFASFWLVYLLQNPSAWGAWLPHSPQGRAVLTVFSVGVNVFAAYRLWRKGEGFSRWIMPAVLAVFLLVNRLY
jgi:hypothetical protein